MKTFKTYLINTQLHDEFHILFPEENFDNYTDDSCNICHPYHNSPNRPFQYFWNWYQEEFPAVSCTSKTVHYFRKLLSISLLLQEHIIRKIIFSIRYSEIISLDSAITKIVRALSNFNLFTIDPFESSSDESPISPFEVAFITPLTSPILKYQRNYLFNHEELNLERLFELNPKTMATTDEILDYLKENNNHNVLYLEFFFDNGTQDSMT